MSHENPMETIQTLRQRAVETVQAVEQRIDRLGPWASRTGRAGHLLGQARRILEATDPSGLAERIAGEDQGGTKPPINDPGGSQVRPNRPTLRAEEAILSLLAAAAHSALWLEVDRAYHAGNRVREAGELLLARQRRQSTPARDESWKDELIHWQSELQATLAAMQA